MRWEVGFDPAFDPEFDTLPTVVQDELLAQAKLLETFGSTLGRPRVDTLNGSRHANMKELRFQADNGVWQSLLPLIPSEKPSCLWPATNRASAKDVVTDN